MAAKTKSSIVKNMKKVKVILGNGFDLHCKLKTSYSHFFNSNIETYKKVAEWRINMVMSNWHNSYTNMRIGNRLSFWRNEPVLNQLTVWDLFFLIKTAHYQNNDLLLNNPNIRWCDIESEMIKSLTESDKHSYSEANALNWHNVYLCLNNSMGMFKTDDVVLLESYILFKTNGNPPRDKMTFFRFLLKQLNTFEKRFGEYINKQYIKSNDYYQNCSLFIKKVFGHFRNIDSVDYFNYGRNKLFISKKKLNLINGDYENPIFGIDTRKTSSNNSEYIFTKNSRRILGDKIHSEVIETNTNYKNVFVYGHSLCEADFSYMFAIIDRLDLLNPFSDARIVFGFSYFPEKTKDEIDSENNSIISFFFEEYAKEKGLSNPSRLLERLMSSNRVIIFEI